MRQRIFGAEFEGFIVFFNKKMAFDNACAQGGKDPLSGCAPKRSDGVNGVRNDAFRTEGADEAQNACAKIARGYQR